MNTLDRKIVLTSTLFITIAIILGALGAHALEKLLSIEKLSSFEVGVKYQMYHGIALIALASISDKLNFSLKIVYRLLITGVLIFSGSIYILVFQELVGVKLGVIFGPLTPIGGLLMISGWITFFVNLLLSKKTI
jgi:uncharacterized membrane protein YgdD (TMEM256/DUF423 family)